MRILLARYAYDESLTLYLTHGAHDMILTAGNVPTLYVANWADSFNNRTKDADGIHPSFE